MICQGLFIFALYILVVGAQEVPLQVEVARNGLTAATPRVVVTAGSIGNVEVTDAVQFVFIPTERGSDGLAAFKVRARGQELSPRIILSGDIPGALA